MASSDLQQPTTMQVPMNIPFPPPMKFTGDKATEWKRFKAQSLNYLTAAKLNVELDERKVALLLVCIGADGFARYDGLLFATADDRQKIEKVLEVYENQFVPQSLRLTSATNAGVSTNATSKPVSRSTPTWRTYVNS